MEILKYFGLQKANTRREKSFLTLPQLFEMYGSDLEDKNEFFKQYEKSLYVYACVKKIAQKVSSVDFELLRIINSAGDTKEIKESPLLNLLYSPNPSQTKKQFIDQWLHNKLLAGENFIWKVRDGKGQVVELYNLRPDLMTTVYSKDGELMGYEFKVSDTTVTSYVPEDIIHDKATNPSNPRRGFSPVKPASSRVETEEYATQFQRDFFRRNARPDAILKVKEYLREDAKEDIQEKWEAKYSGVGKSSKLAILEAGLEYQQVAISQREMDYIESLKFTRDDILVAFQVPKPIVAITDQVNFANAKTALEIFLRETILPEVLNVCEMLNERLVYVDFDPRLTITFTDFIPEDRDLALKEYEKGLTLGYLTINEVRQKEGLEPVVGGWSIYKPMGETPIGGIPQNKAFDLPESDIKKLTATKVKRIRPNAIALKFFEVKADVVKQLTQEVRQELRKDTKAKAQKLRKLFEDPTQRLAYYDAVNKALDDKAKPFAEALIELFSKQEDRVLAGVESELDKAIETKALPKKILDVKKEAKLTAELSLPFLEKYFKESGEQALLGLAPAEEFVIDKARRNALEKRAEYLGEIVTATTVDKLERIIADGLAEGLGRNAISDNIRSVYAELPVWRADMIARTEATVSNNEGLMEGYKQSGVATHKEWVATLDDRTRDEHLALNGETVPVESNFSNGLEFPQEINCRCVVAPVFKED